MNDQFLHDARPQIRPVFAHELDVHLRSLNTQHNETIFLRRPVGLLVSALVLFVAAAAAWQFFATDAHFEAEINGITIHETNYRIIERDLFAMPEVNEDAKSLPGPVIEPRNVYDIIAELPYQFNMPSWVPSGLELYQLNADGPGVVEFFFHLDWFGDDYSPSVTLQVHEVGKLTSEQFLVAPGKWSEIQLDGVRAVLIRGDFKNPFDDYEDFLEFSKSDETWRPAYWDDDNQLTIAWIYDGIYYELGTPSSMGWLPFRTVEFELISESDLIRMAESMIP